MAEIYNIPNLIYTQKKFSFNNQLSGEETIDSELNNENSKLPYKLTGLQHEQERERKGQDN